MALPATPRLTLQHQVRATTHCAFLSLPPELRNRIYELVLLNPREELVITPYPLTPALLRTSSQIRGECSTLYYGRNLFLITAGETNTIPWLCSLAPDMRKHITLLRLYTRCTAVYDPGMEREGKWWILSRLRKEIRRLKLGSQLVLEVFVTEPGGQTRWTGNPLSLSGRRSSRRASRDG